MKITRLALLLLLLLALVSCARNSPSNAIIHFHRSLEQGKIEESMSMLSSRIRSNISDNKLRPALEKTTSDIKAKGGIKKIDILKEEVTGEIATVEYEITFGNGTVQRETTSLSQEGKAWKITKTK